MAQSTSTARGIADAITANVNALQAGQPVAEFCRLQEELWSRADRGGLSDDVCRMMREAAGA